MKTPHLQDFLLWKGKLAQVIGLCDRPTVIMHTIEQAKCPHCGGDLGVEQIEVVIGSPLFQENAEPIKTISND